MCIFHNHMIGFVLAAGALLIADTSDAKVPVAPLKSTPTITQVAQGCGSGGWRDPYGHCRYGGYGYGVMGTVTGTVVAIQTPIALTQAAAP
jgi:hypothetical protein